MTVSTGTAVFSIYFGSVGSMDVVATSGSTSVHVSAITVQTLNIRVTALSPDPTTSLTAFSASISVYGNSNTVVESARGVYTITVAVNPAGTMHGTLTGTTSNGILTLTGLNVLSAGNFVLRATSPGLTQGDSTSFSIVNYVTSITITSSTTTPSANFPFTLSISLYADDSNYYTTNSFISLSANTAGFSGATTGSTSNGQKDLSVYFSTTGAKVVTVSCNSVTQTISITVSANLIKINSISPNPTTSLSVFTVTASVYNTAGNTVEGSYGPYVITLTLSSGTLSGTAFGTTAAGIATIGSLRILSAGSFTITASCPGMTPETSGSIPISNFAHQISVATSSTTPAMNFLFTITVSILAEDNTAFTLGCTITLTSSESLYSNSPTLSNSLGVSSFNIYIGSVGTKVITATCPASGGNSQKTGQVTVYVQNLYVKINSITPNPTTSLATFSVSIGIYNSANTLEDLHANYNIAVSLTPAGTLAGVTTGTTSQGLATLSNLRILTKGTFQIQVTSVAGVTSATSSSSFPIDNYVYSISITTSTETPCANFEFTVTTVLRSEDSNLFTGSCTLSLTAGSSTIQGTTSQTITSGSATFTIRFLTGGSKTLTATCPATASTSAVIATKNLNVYYNLLKLTSLSPTPSNSRQAFGFTVSVRDNLGNNIESNFGPYQIAVALSPAGTLSGTVTLSTTSGAAVFTSLKIQSSGTFIIQATCQDMTVAYSASLAITNYVTYIEMTSSTLTPTAAFTFSVTVTIKGDDNNLFTSSASISLSETGGTALLGTSSGTTTSGSSILGIRINSSGAKIIQATCNSVSTTLNIVVQQALLRINSISPLPTLSNETFSVNLGVYDPSGALESNQGVYLITLTLTPSSGVLSGLSSLSTTGGLLSFTGLKILSSGSFTLRISSPTLVPATSAAIGITNFLNTISVSTSNASPRTYDNFTLSVFLYGDDNNYYPGTCNASLTETSGFNFVGNKYQVTTIGAATFELYFDSKGSKVLNVSCNSKSNTIAITVIDRINPDPICYSSSNSTYCIACVANAVAVNGVCSCVSNSKFSNITRFCECDAGYIASNNFCIVCNNYFLNSEISAILSEDYKKITVSFKRQVRVSELGYCTTFMNFSSSVGEFICIWTDSASLSIIFSSIPPISGLSIAFDPKKLLAVGTVCNLAIEALLVKVPVPAKLPVPLASITAPDTFSITCSSTGLSIFADGIGEGYAYSWNSTTVPENSQINALIRSFNSSSIFLPLSLLSQCRLSVTLNASYPHFSTSAVSMKSILITNSSYIDVVLSTGSYLKVKTTDTVNVRADVNSACGNGSYSYVWSQSIVSTPEFTQIKKAILKPSTLLIPPNVLYPGRVYIFVVQVSDGSISGNQSVTIETVISDLIVALSRSSGEVGTGQDLVITAEVTDPDKTHEAITYLWTCLQGDTECKDTNSSTLLTNPKIKNLLIPRASLVTSATYILTLTASTSSKSTAKSVEIKIVAKEGDIQLPQQTFKINTDQVNNIVPIVKPSTAPKFSWKVTQGSIKSDLPSVTTSYLTIQPQSLTPGSHYILTLSMKSPSDVLSVYVSLTCNVPASCSKLQVTSGTQWLLSIEDCVDGDDSDYPLNYQFAVAYASGEQLWITHSLQVPAKFSILPSGIQTVLGKVCDSLNGCSQYTKSVTVNTRRVLNVLDTFKNAVKNSENVPISIIVYSKLITSTEEFVFFYEKLKEYFVYEIFDENTVSLFLDCISSMFNLQNLMTYSILDDSLSLVNEILKDYNKKLSDYQGQKVLKSYSPYLNRLSPMLVDKLLGIVSSYWVLDSLPGTQIEYTDKKLHFVRYRGDYSLFTGASFKSTLGSISLPSNLPLDSSTIFDLYYTQYSANDSNIAIVKWLTSGTYKGYSLSLSTPSTTQITLTSPIEITINHNYPSDSTLECISYHKFNWSEPVCYISDQNQPAGVSLYYSAVITIEARESSYIMEMMCQFVIYSIMGISVALFIVLIFKDKNVVNSFNATKPFLLLYPLSSIMVAQEKPWRILMASQLVSSEMFLLALTGAYFKYFSTESQISLLLIGKAAMALLITQAFTILCIICNFKALTSRNFVYLSLMCCFIISGGSIGMSLFIMFQDNQKFIGRWTTCFAVFSFLDVFGLQVIYNLCLSLKRQPRIIPIIQVNNDNTDISKLFEDKPGDIKRRNYTDGAVVKPNRKVNMTMEIVADQDEKSFE